MDGTSNGIHGCGNGACPLDRRGFIVQSALFAAAAALAACGAGGDVSAPTLPTTGNSIDVMSFPTLSTVGGVAMISIGGVQLAIVRTGASSFVALSRICPHQGGTVQQSGSGFQCPVHGATFTQTGQWIGGQRTSNLHAYTTAYDATRDAHHYVDPRRSSPASSPSQTFLCPTSKHPRRLRAARLLPAHEPPPISPRQLSQRRRCAHCRRNAQGNRVRHAARVHRRETLRRLDAHLSDSGHRWGADRQGERNDSRPLAGYCVRVHALLPASEHGAQVGRS